MKQHRSSVCVPRGQRLATCLALACALALLADAGQGWAGPLRLVEVQPHGDPLTTQHIVLVNVSSESVLLHEWAIGTMTSPQGTGDLLRFPGAHRVRPGETYIIAFNRTMLRQATGVIADVGAVRGGATGMVGWAHATWGGGGAWSINRASGHLVIVDPQGDISDAVRWGGAAGNGAQLSAPPQGQALYRADPTAPRDDPAAWGLREPDPAARPVWGCGAAVCGNGGLEPGEACDDGNTDDGDGCSATCAVEPGWVCDRTGLDCGAPQSAATECYRLDDACSASLRITGLYLEERAERCASWIELLNTGDHAVPLAGVWLTDSSTHPELQGGVNRFPPGSWLGPGERMLVLHQLEAPPDELRWPASTCSYSFDTQDRSFGPRFGTPTVPWYTLWGIDLDGPSARWPDRPYREPPLLYSRAEQLMVLCDDAERTILDSVGWGTPGMGDDNHLPPDWVGSRVRWDVELLTAGLIDGPVLRRIDEGVDTDTAADWGVSRCQDPGAPLDAPPAIVSGDSIVTLPADGQLHPITLVPDVLSRSDASLWSAEWPDGVSLAGDGGTILVQAPMADDLVVLDWFVLTECWITGRYTTEIRFGDPVRCYPDRDGDGYGDMFSPGVVQVGACADGYVDNGLDCDDDEDLVYPGAPEWCDGLDNDCDPSTPDGSGEAWFLEACDGPDSDLCPDGLRICLMAVAYCHETGPPRLEYCDGLDSDCNPDTPDGSDDPRVGLPCDGDGPDLCVRGTTVCDGGAILCDEPDDPSVVELCDGLDNDCNPGTPDGFDEPDFGARCNVGVGACRRTGTRVCTPAGMACDATPGSPAPDDATCNGLDDDCNGVPDDGFVGTPLTCGVGACQADGATRCEDGRIVADCAPLQPTPETPDSGLCADGIDNDCDGLVDDEDPDCTPLSVCFVDRDGDGRPGTEILLPDSDCWGLHEGRTLRPWNEDCNDDPDDPCARRAWNGATELCDGCDNDCNGLVDELYPGLGDSCATREDICTERSWQCSDDGRSLVCGAPAAIDGAGVPESWASGTCDDGIDNDCDGLIDDQDPDCALDLIAGGGRLFGCASAPVTGIPAAWLVLLIALTVTHRRVRHRHRVA